MFFICMYVSMYPCMYGLIACLLIGMFVHIYFSVFVLNMWLYMLTLLESRSTYVNMHICVYAYVYV